MELPSELSSGTWISAHLVEMGDEVYIVGMTATGSVSVYSSDGEEEINGSIYYDLSEEIHWPVTSVLIDQVDVTSESIQIVVTTMNRGILHVQMDIKNDVIHSTLLPSPSHSITSLSILHTSDPFHLTTHSTCHMDVPSTDTLIASLSDNSLIAYSFSSPFILVGTLIDIVPTRNGISSLGSFLTIWLVV